MVSRGRNTFQKAHFVNYEIMAKADEAVEDFSEILQMIQKDAESEILVESDDRIGRPLKWRIAEVYHGGTPFTTHDWCARDTNRLAIIEIIANHASVALKQMDRFRKNHKLIQFYDSRVLAYKEIKCMICRAWYLVRAFGPFSEQLRRLKTQIKICLIEELYLNPPAVIEEADDEFSE